jgi:hypothetical protein
VPWPGGTEVRVKVTTSYPARAEAKIEVEALPAAGKVRLRIPGCVSKGEGTESRAGQKVQLVLKGKLGHRLEPCRPGVLLSYGPLVLVPAGYGFGSARLTDADRQAPAGYVPESLPAGVPTLKVGGKPDADGFLPLERGPLPEWSCWDEGPQSRTWIEGAAARSRCNYPTERSCRCDSRRCVTTRPAWRCSKHRLCSARDKRTEG